MAKATLDGVIRFLEAAAFPVNRGVGIRDQRLVYDSDQCVEVYASPSVTPIYVGAVGAKIRVYPPSASECNQGAALQLAARTLNGAGFEYKYDGGDPCLYVLSAPAEFGAATKEKAPRTSRAPRDPKVKVGSVVYSRGVINLATGYVGTDTRLIVRELTKPRGGDSRARCERDDGRQGSWWINVSDLHLIGAISSHKHGLECVTRSGELICGKK